MKKIYSFVLMAAALLISTTSWAKVINIGGNAHLQDAFDQAATGDIIRLTDDVTDSKAAWFGEVSATEGDARSIQLDLNGFTYTNTKDVGVMISITRGTLEIVGPGKMEASTAVAKDGQDLIRVYGTYEKIDAKTQAPFAHLIIGEGVVIENYRTATSASAEGSNALTVDVLRPGVPNFAANTFKNNVCSDTYPFDYSCAFYTSGWGVANGVKIEVNGTLNAKKYAMKVNGCIRDGKEAVESDAAKWNPAQDFKNACDGNNFYLPAQYNPAAGDKVYSPYIIIGRTGKLFTNNKTKNSSVALYSAGYSRIELSGECEGSTGVYVKSGDIKLNDAIVSSNFSGAYDPAEPQPSGVSGAGSALTLESNASYAGSMDVEINGDSKLSAENGYAVEEVVTSSPSSEVVNLAINGGTFDGGNVAPAGQPAQEGTIKISQSTVDEAVVSVAGGSVTGSALVGDMTLVDYLSTQTDPTHYTIVDDVLVISEGTGPADESKKTDWADVAALSNKTAPVDAAWTAAGNGQIGTAEEPAEIYLGELQMISGTADNNQILTIKSGSLLDVKHLMMNKYAQIIVEAGAKLIVEGKQGIVAPVASNIILNAADDNRAIFLFNPEVTSNRHPNATVQFVSRSYRENAGHYAWQRFGIPSIGSLEEITAEFDGAPVPTAFAKFDYASDAWTIFGYIHTDGKPDFDYDQLANPFEYYQLLNNCYDATGKKHAVVTMKGELVGNDNPSIKVRGQYWNGFANSYMGALDAENLIALIPNTVQKAFYLYQIDSDGEAYWEPVSLAFMEDIQPMQPFLIRNSFADAEFTLDYEKAVYNPAMGIKKAPAHRSASDMTKVKMIVNGANGTDVVALAEDAQFSAEFDNGYDAVKYMNEGLNMYVSAAEKMAIYATDNLENTYVGFQTVNGGNYTISFTNVQGEDLTLIDLETGARVLMVEGNTYEFTADANSMNDYRFEIVSSKAPTAIENTEAVKSTKGIYTLTGQFVGEMNVWNTLPAGVYVVNGEKRVK